MKRGTTRRSVNGAALDRLPEAAWALRALLLLALTLLVPLAAAQTPGAPAGEAELKSMTAGERADAAVVAWLEQEPISLTQLTQLDTEQLCREIPALLSRAAPPVGTEVRLEDRVERPSGEPGVRLFTYAAVRPPDQLDVVEVRLREESGESTVEYVGFRSQRELSGVRAWLQTDAAAYSFIAFTLLVLLLLTRRGSFLRRWLSAGWGVIREHRRLVIGTQVFLYALFGLGVLTGSRLPEACEQAVLDLVTSAVTTLGATEAYGSGNVARAAVTTFYQNFGVVSASVLLPLAALFGVPAYLFAALSFYTQGIPFGLLGGGGALELFTILILILLELTAYFLVVAGGGILLVTLLRRGEGVFQRALKKLLLMLPFVLLLLLAGAWYESLLLILGA